MKKIVYIVLCAIALTTSSCLNSESNSTPEIYILSGTPLRNQTDTLSIQYSATTGMYTMDTIAIGDTVQFGILFYSYANNIVNIQIESDTNYVTLDYGSKASLDSVFSTKSDYTKGYFNVPIGINQILFPYKYIPKKAGNTVKMAITVNSDANISNNYRIVSIQTPIK